MLARMEHDPALTREQVSALYRTYRDQLSRNGIVLSTPPPAAGTSGRATWGTAHTDQSTPRRPHSSTRRTEIAGWAWSLLAAHIYSWRADRT